MHEVNLNALSIAEAAVGRARVEPDLVIAEMTELLQGAPDMETELTARYALGMAHRTKFDLERAGELLRGVASDAVEAGFPTIGGRALLTLSGSLAMAGRLAEATDIALSARPLLSGGDLAAAYAQIGAFLLDQERHAEALEAADEALAMLRNMPDEVDRLPKINGNRGLALVGLGRYEEAYEAFVEGWAHVDADLSETASLLSHLGWVAAMRGDLVDALTWFERLSNSESPGEDDPGWLVDYAITLSQAGLDRQAREVGEAAVRRSEEAGLDVRVARAHMATGMARLDMGDLDAAWDSAAQSAESFERMGTDPYRAKLLKARILLAREDIESVDAAEKIVAGIDHGEHRRNLPEVESLLAIRLAELGDADRARRWLPDESETLTMAEGVLVATAAAYVEDADGSDRVDVLLAEAIELASSHRAFLGASDLRSGSKLGLLAAELGLRRAVERRDLEAVLGWAERFRATAQRRRPVKAASDGDDAARYRLLSVGKTSGLLDADEHIELVRLERQMKEQARTATAVAGSVTMASLADIQRRLSGATLVEFVNAIGGWWALVIRSEACELVELPDADLVPRRLDALEMAVGRLRSRPDDLGLFDKVVAELDDLLVAPWWNDDLDVVIAPTGMLDGVPWAALPSLTNGSIRVTPSANVWLRPDKVSRPGAAFAAGPDLEHAEQEVESLAAQYPGGIRLVGDEASVEAVLGVMNTVGLIHIAAHGSLRSDNPLFSSLRLADGPLNVYDIEGLSQPPGTVVLSSCSVGSTVAGAGANSLGLATSFLSMGSAHVVASLFEVDDMSAMTVMELFHTYLADGSAPGLALAKTRQNTSGPARIAALSFQCYE